LFLDFQSAATSFSVFSSFVDVHPDTRDVNQSDVGRSLKRKAPYTLSISVQGQSSLCTGDKWERSKGG